MALHFPRSPKEFEEAAGARQCQAQAQEQAPPLPQRSGWQLLWALWPVPPEKVTRLFCLVWTYVLDRSAGTLEASVLPSLHPLLSQGSEKVKLYQRPEAWWERGTYQLCGWDSEQSVRVGLQIPDPVNQNVQNGQAKINKSERELATVRKA